MKQIGELIKEMKERCDAATEGPWTYEHGHDHSSVFVGGTEFGVYENPDGTNNHQDITFIAHARTDIPRLIAALEEVIIQRDYWAQYAPQSVQDRHVTRDNAELLRILGGEGE